jgi:signal transduction histidine kinase
MLFCADHSLRVLADSLWIEQVMENLLDNAIKYTKGGGEVIVKIYQKKGKVFYEVQDSGVGIPKTEQNFIFEKFFRSNNESRYRTEGAGLGLYLVKAILKNFGGEVWFESELNKGSTFYVSLPMISGKMS